MKLEDIDQARALKSTYGRLRHDLEDIDLAMEQTDKDLSVVMEVSFERRKVIPAGEVGVERLTATTMVHRNPFALLSMMRTETVAALADTRRDLKELGVEIDD